MENISGDFNTKKKEIEVVKYLLDSKGIPYKDVKEYDLANDADVIVTFHTGKTLLIEVKEESYERINTYGDLGIDYISSCVFKNDAFDFSRWKGIHKPDCHTAFLNSLDENNRYFKWGKVKYSKSDIWLFYTHYNNSYPFIETYNGNKMTSDEFLNYLRSNCSFAVNNKPPSQKSFTDSHHSAVFFINRFESKLNDYKVDIKDYL